MKSTHYWRLFSPKGWHKSAQGNALGTVKRTWPQALKGRYNLLLPRRLLRPFRARTLYLASIPRALPWAGLLRPLRGELSWISPRAVQYELGVQRSEGFLYPFLPPSELYGLARYLRP
jgi:hypothetical protein